MLVPGCSSLALMLQNKDKNGDADSANQVTDLLKSNVLGIHCGKMLPLVFWAQSISSLTLAGHSLCWAPPH